MSNIDLKLAPLTLRTARLRLESPTVDHAAAFAEGVTASISKLGFVAWSLQACDLEWARLFCENDARSVAAGHDLAFHIFESGSGAWVGRVDVHTIEFCAGRGEIGYVGDARHAGRGLMREAAAAVIDLCFRIGFERIEAMSDARNTRALHFAETLGMQREGVLRHHDRDLQGQLCDVVLFAVLKPAAL